MNIKHNINYFKKNETLGLIGLGILVVSIFFLWIARAIHARIFFLISPPAIVAGFVMFIVGNSGRSSEDDIDACIKSASEGLESDFSGDIHYSRLTQKQIEPKYVEGYEFEDGVMIKRAKNGSLRSSKYSKALVYVMTDRLYINKKTISLVSEEVEKTSTEILFDSIRSIGLKGEEKDVVFNKKTFRTKPFNFTVEYGDGEKFVCPAFDNMESVDYVESLNRYLDEYRKTKE